MEKFDPETFQKRHPDFFSELDIHFARFIQRISGNKDPVFFLTIAFLSRETAAGHICLDLAELAGTPVAGKTAGLSFPELSKWRQTLEQVSAVGFPGEFKPVILDSGGRLYLYRYWQYQTLVAQTLIDRSKATRVFADMDRVRDRIRLFFPDREAPDMQKAAAVTALFRNLCIICGGPGTGKTTTVARILALLLDCTGQKLRIALAAPTGKAADRLQKAVSAAKPGLPCTEEILSQIPDQAATLHRLLGTVPGSVSFRYNRDNPLPYDVVVIDEASMVDLPLLAKTLSATAPDTRILIVGDRDQLASVESGAALGDICTETAINAFSPDLVRTLHKTTQILPSDHSTGTDRPPLADNIVVLNENFRFKNDSAIFLFSRAVSRGDEEAAFSVLTQNKDDDIYINRSFLTCFQDTLPDMITRHILPFMTAASPEQALEILDHFRILCPLRAGPLGAKGINLKIERYLQKSEQIPAEKKFYHGRPILITQNDYSLNLFNGDTGIIFSQSGDRENLKAFFPGKENTCRAFSPASLPAHETVFAMTVHKSQGSEFDEILLVLPDSPSPVLTRELIYTAVTRAKKKLQVVGAEAVLKYAVSRKISRRSGLTEQLEEIRRS